MKDRQARDIRGHSSDKQKQRFNKRDRTLRSIRQEQVKENEKSLGFFDFILDFGVLC